jgi:hypothetical protein
MLAVPAIVAVGTVIESGGILRENNYETISCGQIFSFFDKEQ